MINRRVRSWDGMRRTQIDLLPPVCVRSGDFHSQLNCRQLPLHRLSIERLVPYLGITQKALCILHLNAELFIIWEIEEPNTLFTNFVVEFLVDSRVLDVQEAYVEERVAQMFKKSRLCRVFPRQGHVQDGNLLERHLCGYRNCGPVPDYRWVLITAALCLV